MAPFERQFVFVCLFVRPFGRSRLFARLRREQVFAPNTSRCLDQSIDSSRSVIYGSLNGRNKSARGTNGALAREGRAREGISATKGISDESVSEAGRR